MTINQLETHDLTANYIIEGIGHAMMFANVLYAMSLREWVLATAFLGSVIASLVYHLCDMGVIFSALLLTTLRRSDYLAIQNGIVVVALRLFNFTYQPKKLTPEFTKHHYYKRAYKRSIMAIVIVLTFANISFWTSWVIFDTWAGNFITFGTLIMLFYLSYIKYSDPYCLDGWWIGVIDIVIGISGVSLLYYAGNPGDAKYGLPHGSWHIVAAVFIFLLIIYIRKKDCLTCVPYPVTYMLTYVKDIKPEKKNN